MSTIIPVYNRSGLLREAVASVLAQTYRPIEVIIVNDGSTDDTAAACDELAETHPEVRALHLEHRGRVGLVREAGRLAARGEYLQYLDSDDLLLPAKFTAMVGALQAHPECGIAYCYSRRYRRGQTPVNVPSALTGETHHTMLPAFLGGRFWHTSTPLYRSALCDRAGAWSDLLVWEDVVYDVRIATLNPRLIHCREFLTDFRDHDLGRMCDRSDYRDLEKLSEMARAAALIYHQVRDYGLPSADEYFRFFLENVWLLQRRCRDEGLAVPADGCAEILREAWGADRRSGLGELTLRAAIEPQVAVLEVHPGDTAHLAVRVVNESPVSFRGGDFAFELGSRLIAVDGNVLEADNPRILFDPPLPPREDRLVSLPIPAPTLPGIYYLEIDILWGATDWLGASGNPRAIVKLVVRDLGATSSWLLEAQPENRAQLVFPSDDPDRVRVAIAVASTSTAWHIQLNQRGRSARAGRRYRISFRARADRTRSLFVGFAKAREPWSGLGLYQQITLTPEWQDCAVDFVATETEPNARIHFDLGGSDSAVELAGVRFQDLSDQKAPEPPVAASLARLQMDIGVAPWRSSRVADPGRTIHGYYVERFLTEYASSIRGHCLEFRSGVYAAQIGGAAVATVDILHGDDPNPLATLVGGLPKPTDLPANRFDCIICTHVLQGILELDRAVEDLHRLLKPGGVLLVAEPHVSRAGLEHRELWRFTPEGLRTVLARAFGPEGVTIRGYGNSLTAAGELRGVGADEFTPSELQHHDPGFAVEVCASAIKSHPMGDRSLVAPHRVSEGSRGPDRP